MKICATLTWTRLCSKEKQVFTAMNGDPGCKKVHICNFHSASGKSSGLIEGKMGAEKTLFLSQKGKFYAAVSAAPKSVKAAGAKAADDITAELMT